MPYKIKYYCKFEELLGKTLIEINGEIGSTNMSFKTSENEIYSLYHAQDWCERCDIVDIVGDLSDLLNTPILLAEEITNEQINPAGVKIPEYQDSFTWTFYKLSTIKGSVTISWYGESNGYYNERVEFQKLTGYKA